VAVRLPHAPPHGKPAPLLADAAGVRKLTMTKSITKTNFKVLLF
jgi:hypothetical protein